MKEKTRDILLWLAGLGGAIIILQQLIGILLWGVLAMILLGLFGVLLLSAFVVLLVVRSRLDDAATRPTKEPNP